MSDGVGGSMARILIIYGTRYGSTKTIAEWIAEGAASTGHVDVVVQNVAEADLRGFNFIVIGSPIYEEHPLPSVVNFLAANRDRLSDKDVALFVVCVDYGAVPKEELVRRYVADLQARAAGRVQAIEVFGGYLDVDKLSETDRKLIEDFAKLMGVPITQVNKLDKQSRANSERTSLTSSGDHSC
ncbi:MAG TPA: flavodoxin domain-containing protein [Candidatus Bathyarchaeia archaeon]|nr:flavodoxin domain-containing protein [Candidatus Bathyarchaeia archaeon]